MGVGHDLSMTHDRKNVLLVSDGIATFSSSGFESMICIGGYGGDLVVRVLINVRGLEKKG